MSATRKQAAAAESTASKRERRPSTDLETLHVRQANLDINVGDCVNYKHRMAVETPSTGRVVSIITDKVRLGKRHFLASENQPKVVIKNDKSNKKTAYDPTHIIGKATDDRSSSN